MLVPDQIKHQLPHFSSTLNLVLKQSCQGDTLHIYNTIVTIEDPRKLKTVVQCTKCQQYGHTKNNCLRPYRCVKCAEAHNTSDCPKKDRNSPAKCALCLGSHPAIKV